MRRMELHTVSTPKISYTMTEAELATGLSRASLYRAIARGELRRQKIGKRTLILSEDLRAFCGGGLDRLAEALARATQLNRRTAE
ncbi:MAG: helix-turn-helix domain-containing protein [Gammaproteobacteria bacterium]